MDSYYLMLLAWSASWGILCLALTSAGLARAPRRLGLAALACALYSLALVLPSWQVLAAMLGFDFPAGSPLYHPIDWAGKAAALLVSAIFIYGIKRPTPAEAGLRGPRWATLRVVGPVVGTAAALLLLDAYVSRHVFPTLWRHEMVFYSLVPGLGEELFYRGVLLGLLSAVFPRTVPLPGTRSSWGGLISVLLFALAHGIKLNLFFWMMKSGWQVLWDAWWWHNMLHFSLSGAAYYLTMGLILLWVREYTNSVWAAVAAHCLFNTALTIGHAMA